MRPSHEPTALKVALLGPLLNIPPTRSLWQVAGRIAIFCADGVRLFDVNTGAPVAFFDDVADWVENTNTKCVVLDRWIPFCTASGRALLVDCVAARLVEVTPPCPHRYSYTFSSAGALLSHRTSTNDDANYTIVHIKCGPADVTVVREVTRVQHPHGDVLFALCERGQSYLLLDRRERTLQLVDLHTRQLKRSFMPRECTFLLFCIHQRLPSSVLPDSRRFFLSWQRLCVSHHRNPEFARRHIPHKR